MRIPWSTRGVRFSTVIEARVVAILRYTLRSDVPKKLNSDNQRDSVTEKSTEFRIHYKTNSRVIRRVIRFGLVIEYHPDYRVNYQPDYRPGSTEVPAW